MIQKRGGRWRVVVQAGRDPISGKRSQLSRSAPTEREAVRLERQLRLQAEGSVTGNVRLSDVVDDSWSRGPRLAATTLANYRDNLDNHILPVLGGKKVGEIRPRLVAAYLTHLSTEKGLGPATVRKVRTVLSAVMSFAVAMEYVESTSVMKVPPPEMPREERIAPTVEETARILLAAEEVDPDLLTYLWVAAEEGGRRGETLAVRWRDIDFKAGTLLIEHVITIGDDGVQVRQTTKTKKARPVAVSQVTLDYLLAHRQRLEEAVLSAAGDAVPVDGDALVFSGGVEVDATAWTGSHGGRIRRAAVSVRSRIRLVCGMGSTSMVSGTQ
jgi:integrase